jgi:hypothetical protein
MQKQTRRQLGSLPKAEASFIEPMECLSVSKLPEGDRWIWEILCGGPHRLLLWCPTLCGAGDEVWLQMHAGGSPTPHNSYQSPRRNCISATSSFQCFGGTAPWISQVASALAFISRPKFQDLPKSILLIPGGIAQNSPRGYWEQPQ